MTETELKTFVEHEWAAWLKAIPTAQKRNPKKKKQASQDFKMKKELRRDQYAGVQTLFKKNGGGGGLAWGSNSGRRHLADDWSDQLQSGDRAVARCVAEVEGSEGRPQIQNF